MDEPGTRCPLSTLETAVAVSEAHHQHAQRKARRNMSTPLLLSIDFDFWIPVRRAFCPLVAEQGGEKDRIQWVRRVVEAWEQNVDLRKEIRLAPKEWPTPQGLAKWLTSKGIVLADEGIAIADQHHYAFQHFHDAKDGWLFHVDAHHDMGYDVAADRLNCGNWVQRLVEAGSVKRVTLIYPEWRQAKRYRSEMETPDAIKARRWLKARGTEVEVQYGMYHLPANSQFTRTILARSGAWTPPWLDATCVSLAASLTRTPTIIYETTPSRPLDVEGCRRLAKGCLQDTR
jgi:hypothetical protein